MKTKRPVIKQSKKNNGTICGYHDYSKTFYYKLYYVSNRTGRYAIDVEKVIAQTLKKFWNISLSELFENIREKARNFMEFKRSGFGRGEVSVSKSLIRTADSCADIFKRTKKEFDENGANRGFSKLLELCSVTFRSFWENHKRVLNYLAPAAGIAVLTFTIALWSNTNIALKVIYNGRTLGYIQSEETFRAAVSNVETDVRDASGNVFQLKYTPQFELAIIPRSQITTEGNLSENIVLNSGDQVVTGYGLYVDNRLVGVNKNQDSLNQMLDRILASNKKAGSDDQVEFVQDVSIKRGVFPDEVVKPVKEIETVLTAKQTDQQKYVTKQGDTVIRIATKFNIPLTRLYDMNPIIASNQLSAGQPVVVEAEKPLLNVKIIRKEQFKETISYDVSYVPNSSLYKGKSEVHTSGANGEKMVTAEVTYIDDVAVDKKELDEKVTKAPVTQVVYTGTKERPSTSPTGSFMWPIASGVGYISQRFGQNGHPGIDIACAQGTPIRAADGGIVIFAGWDSSGFGNHVKISHGNGLVTIYGHACKVLVSTGSRVFKGQVIALVGHTGRVSSPTANHLHFQVQLNGSVVNPLRYVG